MCGIIGYFGNQDCVDILINGLKRLEYRGYDSCGLAIIDNKKLNVVKTEKRVNELKKKSKNTSGKIGIAHTRWATHGQPNKVNAHPHTDSNNNLAIVHNGIIENFESLKEFLESKGYEFKTETDSEVIAHLISYFYKDNLKEAVKKALKQVVGTYGLAVIHKESNEMIVSRKGSPIVLGIGKEEYFIASDVSAIIEYTKDVIYLEDNEIIEINNEGYKITDMKDEIVDKEINKVKMKVEEIEKKGYPHFMLKEIFEQPDTLKQAILGRIDYENLQIKLGGIEKNLSDKFINELDRIIILACGTSWHAALVSKFYLEKHLRIPVEVDFASEFRYKDPILSKDSLVITISQSGETADTIEALKEVKKNNVKVLGIVNVVGSTIARESDCGIFIRAGPEIGVASTKAFTNQLISLLLLTIYLGRKKETISISKSKDLIKEIGKLPNLLDEVLNKSEKIKDIAKKYTDIKSALFIGRGINYPIALEGALKLKEISYIHAEGFPAGEMKHGPIALIEEGLPVFSIATKEKNYEKVLSNIHEAKTRGAKIISTCTENDPEVTKVSDDIISLRSVSPEISPFLNNLCWQLVSYYIADFRDCEIDKPRNLAKSVTVE